MEADPIFAGHEKAFVLKILPFLLIFGALLLTAPVSAEVLSVVPPAVKALVDVHKYNEASILLYSLIDAEAAETRLFLIKLVYDLDPETTRLDAAMDRWLHSESDGVSKQWIARNLGQLRLLKRDYQGALAAFAGGGDDPELQLQSGSICLLTGDFKAAEQRLQAVLRSGDSGLVEAANCALAWKQWAEGNALSAYQLVSKWNGPAALGLQCLLARSLGLQKEEQTARDKLHAAFPKSVYFELIDSDNDPAIQMDTALMVLLGIGPAANGSVNLLATTTTPRPNLVTASSSPTGDDQVAKSIQVGYFKSAANAKKLADRLKSEGFLIQVDQEKETPIRWKVTVLIPAGKDPQALIVRLKDLGIEGFLSF